MSTPRERLAIFLIVIFLIIGFLLSRLDDEFRMAGIACFLGASAAWRFMLRGGHESQDAEGTSNAR